MMILLQIHRETGRHLRIKKSHRRKRAECTNETETHETTSDTENKKGWRGNSEGPNILSQIVSRWSLTDKLFFKGRRPRKRKLSNNYKTDPQTMKQYYFTFDTFFVRPDEIFNFRIFPQKNYRARACIANYSSKLCKVKEESKQLSILTGTRCERINFLIFTIFVA